MFEISIYTHKEILYFGLVKEVVLPTEEGQITIMDFHQPILCRLCAGTICIDNKWFFNIKDGVGCIKMGKLRIIVET